ncbi:MAG TPA: GntR family transcriptional regulator [Planctomycetota bacterium]|nr:GntR family transcriptional regulator [Planctomycetota bacterium]
MRTNGRTSTEFAARLRQQIAKGGVAAGSFLPSERELSEKHKVGRKAVRLALKTLETEGAIATIPRHGYKVLPPKSERAAATPAAYVAEFPEDAGRLTGRSQAQLAEFSRAADRRGWPLLVASTRGRSTAEVLDQLRAAGTVGAVLDTTDGGLIRAVAGSGLPAVLVDAWREDVELDSVMQDGHQGGLLAVAHLAARGHRRIAWFGSTLNDAHSKDRFGGFAAGMAAAGLPLERDLCLAVDEPDAPARARELLSRPNRPTAIVALWAGLAAPTARAAAELGLAPGKGLEIVGWSMAEVFETAYVPLFGGLSAPPTVTWSVRTMAEAALARLSERRLNPGMAALRVRVPVKLRGVEG